MTDVEYLFVVVAGFYIWECVFWARPGMFVFSCQLGGARLRCANLRWAILGNCDGAALLGNLVPLGHAGICQQWPLSLSPQGIYSFVSQAFSRDGRPRQQERYVAYGDIQSVEAQGSQLLINQALFAATAVPSFARLLAATIRRLADLPEMERGPAIEDALAHHLDPAQVRQRLALFQRLSADLQITCLLLFFLVFLLAPLLVFLHSLFPFGVFAGSYLAFLFLAFVQFRRTHRHLYPEDRSGRWKNLLVMLISPADAIHARDKLSRELLGDFNPLAVAQVVCPPAVFQQFAGDVWRDLEYSMLPVCPAQEDGPRQTELWFRERFRAQLGRLLRESGVNADQLLLPPRPENSLSRSYCPRCLGQYILETGTCIDCGGRPLCQLRGAR